MQISYHFALTKIQKLQNLKKKKKKTFFCTDWYCPKLAGTGGIFSGMKQGGLYVPVCLPVWYIPVLPAGTVQNRLPCFQELRLNGL